MASGPPEGAKPKWTGALREVDLQGLLLPWEDAGPVLINMHGSDYYYLPLFSDREKLDALMRRVKIDPVRITRIDDAAGFLEGLAENPDFKAGQVKLIIDPVILDDGRVRYGQYIGEN